MIPKVGEQFRRFRILSRVGAGGMGVVLKARDTQLERDVALKFLTGIGSADAQLVARLRIEARSLAALNSPNIVTIYDLEDFEGVPFLVLEWVPGVPVGSSPLQTPFPEEAFLRLALPTAEALAAAHLSGIVHRDIKPSNVLVTADGRVKLVDFGLARIEEERTRITRAEAVLGTVAYMSPEQIDGSEILPASDIFSFGILAYELLAGRRPFGGSSFTSTLYAICNEPPARLETLRPDLSPSLVRVIHRCLEKDPLHRYASGTDLAVDLHAEIRQLGAAPRGSEPATPRGAGVDQGVPQIRYCRTSDGASIAYSVHGSGPLIVRVLGWFTHLEMEWEWPALRKIWELLGRTHTVVRYDGRGIGLSSPWDDEFSEETRQLDLQAVLDAIGPSPVILYGISEGGWTAVHCAERHPERVRQLVIYGAYSRGVRFRPGYDPEEIAAVEVLMRKGWGRETPQYRQMFTSAYFGPDADPGLVSHFNRQQRAAASGETAYRYQHSLNQRPDASEIYSSISVPALVMHCRDDQIVPFEEGRRVASLIPGAQFIPLPTGTHYFPVDDEVTRRITEAIDRFTENGPATH